MDIKLSMLFLLIGSIIGLSHLSSEKLARFMREFGRKPAPPVVPRRRETQA